MTSHENNAFICLRPLPLVDCMGIDPHMNTGSTETPLQHNTEQALFSCDDAAKLVVKCGLIEL